MPPTKVATIEELDRRRAAALGKYLRIYEPRCGCGWWLVREINKQEK